MTPSNRYVIVVGLDFSALGDTALHSAVELAASKPQAELHIVHVAEPYGPMLRVMVQDDERTVSAEEARAFLVQHATEVVESVEPHVDPSSVEIQHHLRAGSAAEEIVDCAREVDADLIVVGTHGRKGVKRLILGSVAESVARRAACAVLVVRHKTHGEEVEA